MRRFLAERRNEYLLLPESIRLETDLSDAVSNAGTIVISIDSQGLAGLMSELEPFDLCSRDFVLCMKGIEMGTCRRLSEVVDQSCDASNRIAVWLGPGHVQEFYRGLPNCMVIDSQDENMKEHLISAFSGPLIRFYYGNDMIGNEIGAASKNVVGIAAGALDGIGRTSLKGALMSRGTREVARLISAMGGNELSAYGLCHLGDYEATVFSEHSHNRRFGELFARGEKFDRLAEGYYTAAAMVGLGKKYNVELPICSAIYRCLYENADLHTELAQLFTRSLKREF